MGSSGSKAARTAATAPRKYPTRAPPSSVTQAAKPSASTPTSELQAQQDTQTIHPPSSRGPTVHPPPQATSTRTEAIERDASDPVYDSNLRTLGAVQPNPILSHSSTHPGDPTTRVTPSAATSRRPREHADPFGGQPLPASAFPQAMNNPALRILDARDKWQERAEREFQARGLQGREFLDVGLIRQMLMLRDQRGMGDEEVEKRLELKSGVVKRLGPRGMVESL